MADKRQKKKRESKGAYWMDTYGDMVTLLLTFFVMLFASSQMNESKWMKIVASFTGEPVGSVVEPIDPLNPTSGFAPSDYIPKVTPKDKIEDETAESDSDLKMEYDYKVEATFNDLYNKLTEYISEHNLGSTIVVQKDGQYIYITILEGILFESGEADIRDETAEKILNDLGNMMMESWDSVNLLKIEGHTDTDPINTVQFKDNRSLSSERANEVLRFFHQSCGMQDSDRIESTGWGEVKPVATNDTQEGKQQNRRVEFILESKNALTK